MTGSFQLDGWFADFDRQNFYFGRLSVEEGKVVEIVETGERRLGWEDRDQVAPVILPGLVDSHVHIESSMLIPSGFAERAVRFGTVSTVSDPHEIANVLGLDGIRLMINNARNASVKIYFTAPSCVPATSLESAGAVLGAQDLEPLFAQNDVVALGEMMNYPGVIAQDPGVIAKIELARKYGKTVDGHAPGLIGDALDAYIGAGIHTDHECFTMAEAEEKIAKGMKVLIREGSSAKNFEALFPLIDRYPERVMLCSDDYHPDDLVKGHIDRLVRRGVQCGLNFFNVYRSAGLNAIQHYQLKTGRLNPGDPADFIVASGVDPFYVTATYIDGQLRFGTGAPEIEPGNVEPLNAFNALPVVPADLEVRGKSGLYRVIRVYDGELITGSETAQLDEKNGCVQGNTDRDILKIVVMNRYKPSKPAIGWITGFGLKKGALASSIAHDSHNIIAVGTSDREIADAMNQVIAVKGGIAVGVDGSVDILPLPIAGLMSGKSAEEVGLQYAKLTEVAKNLGSALKAPFMALSFMALLVIPHLKIGDLGLFNCDTFEFTDIKAD